MSQRKCQQAARPSPWREPCARALSALWDLPSSSTCAPAMAYTPLAEGTAARSGGKRPSGRACSERSGSLQERLPLEGVCTPGAHAKKGRPGAGGAAAELGEVGVAGEGGGREQGPDAAGREGGSR